MAETIKKGARVVGPHRDKLAAELVKEYARGTSIRDIAAKTGRSYGFVHRILSESGTELRGRGGATRGARKTGATAAAKPARKSAAKGGRKKRA